MSKLIAYMYLLAFCIVGGFAYYQETRITSLETALTQVAKITVYQQGVINYLVKESKKNVF